MSDSHARADRRPTDPDDRLLDPEDRGAPVAESHIVVSDHDDNVRIDIADDAVARPGPGPGQPEADGD